jgi:mRNA export factor
MGCQIEGEQEKREEGKNERMQRRFWWIANKKKRDLIFTLFRRPLLQFWDARSPTPVGEFTMPERVYDLDVRGNLMVVATANRHVLIYDVSGPQPREHSRKESPLKYNTRCVSCFPDQTGFAIGSIEGRVGVQYVQKVGNKDHFAFKCHRQDTNVYSVNAIAFQQQYGTFATVGSDGVVTFWDKDNKQRLKAFNPIRTTIPCAAFNATGSLFAYACSYDWSKGSSFYTPGTPNEIFVHPTADDEIKPKGSRKK